MSKAGPQNARVNSDGFRVYSWDDAATGERTEVLSVTSVRKLCGENYNVVNWQIGNVLDTVLGTVKRPKPGKRVAFLKGQYVYAIDEYPSEFAQRYEAVEGKQSNMDDLRKWVRAQADHPRNIAAVRGSIVHKAVERGVSASRIERPWVEVTFADMSQRDKDGIGNHVGDEDVEFIKRAVANYWDMRKQVPFVIVAREPQVWNLEVGYGGSADQLLWFLGDFDSEGEFIPLPNYEDILANLPQPHLLTLNYMQDIGGFLAVGDVKTSGGVYTEHVVQCQAYGAAEFVGEDGVINRRLTDIINATTRGVLLHVRPEYWGVHIFDFNEPVLRAFIGSVAFARFLFEYPRAEALFIQNLKGTAPFDNEDQA